jgi:hypothetical protein
MNVSGFGGGRPQKAVAALAQMHDQTSGLGTAHVGLFIIDIRHADLDIDDRLSH